MRIHREGFLIIPISLILIGGIILGGWYIHPNLGVLLLVAGFILFFLIVYFFRDPLRQIPVDEQAILSPCDGKVVVIEELPDHPFFNKAVLQISIFMSPLNVHVNRNPISGKVVHYTYYPGKYLMAFNPKSSQLNEQNLVVTEQNGVKIGYKQIAGFMARRIRCYIQEGDQVQQGKEFGFIRFGSRVDLLLPIDCKVQVQLGDKVKGGLDVVARVAHDSASPS